MFSFVIDVYSRMIVGWQLANHMRTELSRHSADDLAAVAHALNSRPRKTLGWQTPAEELNRLIQSSQQPAVATTG